MATVQSAQEDSFDRELQFYELLDLDAKGEDDIDIDTSNNQAIIEQVLGFE